MIQTSPSSAPSAESRSFKLAWAGCLLLILSFVLGLLLVPPMSQPFEGKASDSMLLIGRFHPVFVHLPVGALAVVALLELLCLRRSMEEKFGDAALLTLFIGSAGAVMAVMAGIMLSREGGYEGGNFTLHQGIGVAASAGVLLSLVLRIQAMRSGRSGIRDTYRVVFFGSMAFLGLGAHFGGNIVHGSKYLTEYAPPAVAGPVRSMEKWLIGLVEKPETEPKPEPAPVLPTAPAPPVPPAPPAVVAQPQPANPAGSQPPAATVGGQSQPPTDTGGAVSGADDSQTVFTHLILPMLDAKCNKCHNEEKSKGDLRMDTHEFLLQGGEDEPGKTVVPGKPEESLALTLLKLPLDDEDHMPPEGKDQMTTDEIALLEWWIKEGASPNQKLKDAQIPASLQSTADAYLKK